MEFKRPTIPKTDCVWVEPEHLTQCGREITAAQEQLGPAPPPDERPPPPRGWVNLLNRATVFVLALVLNPRLSTPAGVTAEAFRGLLVRRILGAAAEKLALQFVSDLEDGYLMFLSFVSFFHEQVMTWLGKKLKTLSPDEQRALLDRFTTVLTLMEDATKKAAAHKAELRKNRENLKTQADEHQAELKLHQVLIDVLAGKQLSPEDLAAAKQLLSAQEQEQLKKIEAADQKPAAAKPKNRRVKTR